MTPEELEKFAKDADDLAKRILVFVRATCPHDTKVEIMAAALGIAHGNLTAAYTLALPQEHRHPFVDHVAAEFRVATHQKIDILESRPLQ